MPIHDWTRVDPNDYHHFHGRWIYAIADALNLGILPTDFFALAEHVTDLGRTPTSKKALRSRRCVAVRRTLDRHLIAVIELIPPFDRSMRSESAVFSIASHGRIAAEFRTFVEAVAVGDALPDMPLFLEDNLYVNVPLESAYQAAWATYPEYLREQIER